MRRYHVYLGCKSLYPISRKHDYSSIEILYTMNVHLLYTGSIIFLLRIATLPKSVEDTLPVESNVKLKHFLFRKLAAEILTLSAMFLIWLMPNVI